MSIDPADNVVDGTANLSNARSPHGNLYTRDYVFPLPVASARQFREQAIRDSILDSLWSRLGARKKPVSPDSFERFLRVLKEATLADIYHNLNEQSASHFKGLFWFASSVPAFSNGTFIPLISNMDLPVADFFDQVRRAVQDVDPNTVRLCCMTKTAPDIRQLFSYFRLFSLSVYSEPQFWARILLIHLLLWSQYVTQPFADVLLQNTTVKDDTRKAQVFRLPSQGASTSFEWNFDYEWPYDIIDFSIVDIHTRRPYKVAPSLEKIQFYTSRKDKNSYDLILLFDSTRALDCFKSHLEPTTNLNTAIAGSTALHSVYRIIFAIHQHMNEQSLRFLETVFNRSSEMVIHSRDHPGRAEYLYLVILQDYVTAALAHLGAAKEQLSRQLPEPVPPELEPQKTDILKDMDYLMESLHKATKHLVECQQQAKSLEELKQNQIAGIMSFLVAVYVPVAFVSSYFGMNTVEILNGDLHNVTFWQISIPLMVLTIMLPLSLTIIARVTRGISLSIGVFSLRQWPMIVDICITLFFLSLFFAHIVHWRLSEDSNFVVFFTRISSSETLIVDCLFAGLFLLKAIENSILRNRRGRLWFYFFLAISLVAGLCAALSVLDHSIATMLAPIVFTLLALAVRPLLF